MRKILIYRLRVHTVILYILTALLPVYNILINFAEDKYAYKETGGNVLVISLLEFAGGILPGLAAIYAWIFVIILTSAILNLNKGMPYKEFWYTSPFDNEHITHKTKKHAIAQIIIFVCSITASVIIRLILSKPIFTSCCWAPTVGFAVLLYVSVMAANIKSHTDGKTVIKNEENKQ